jgi:hypothetical protein
VSRWTATEVALALLAVIYVLGTVVMAVTNVSLR